MSVNAALRFFHKFYGKILAGFGLNTGKDSFI